MQGTKAEVKEASAFSIGEVESGSDMKLKSLEFCEQISVVSSW